MLSASEHYHGSLRGQKCKERPLHPDEASFPSHWTGGRSQTMLSPSHQYAHQPAPLPNPNLPRWNPLSLPDGQRGSALSVVFWRSILLLRAILTTSKYLLSAPTFQEIPGNPVKRATHRVTASEIVLERAVEECGQWALSVSQSVGPSTRWGWAGTAISSVVYHFMRRPLPFLLWDPSHPFHLWIPRRKPQERVKELIHWGKTGVCQHTHLQAKKEAQRLGDLPREGMLCGLPFIWTTKTSVLMKDISQKILGPRSSLLLWEICPQVLAGFVFYLVWFGFWQMRRLCVEAWSMNNIYHLPPVYPPSKMCFPSTRYNLQLLIYSMGGASTSTGHSSLTHLPCLGRPLTALSAQWQRTGGYLGMVTIRANLREKTRPVFCSSLTPEPTAHTRLWEAMGDKH